MKPILFVLSMILCGTAQASQYSDFLDSYWQVCGPKEGIAQMAPEGIYSLSELVQFEDSKVQVTVTELKAHGSTANMSSAEFANIAKVGNFGSELGGYIISSTFGISNGQTCVVISSGLHAQSLYGVKNEEIADEGYAAFKSEATKRLKKYGVK